LVPRFGVYAVRVSDRRGEGRLPAVANYGLRPTVELAEDPRLEVHVLGECPWKEGDTVVVELQEFLRAEQTFPSVEALAAQIARDREKASEFFLR
jgi:riboflavin kinase/FMN adenylyltransferase